MLSPRDTNSGSASLENPVRRGCWDRQPWSIPRGVPAGGYSPRQWRNFPSWVCLLVFLDVLVSPCLPTSMQIRPPTCSGCSVPKFRTPRTGGGLGCCRNKIWEEDSFACHDRFVDFTQPWKSPAPGDELCKVFSPTLIFPGHEPGPLSLDHGGRRRKPPRTWVPPSITGLVVITEATHSPYSSAAMCLWA